MGIKLEIGGAGRDHGVVGRNTRVGTVDGGKSAKLRERKDVAWRLGYINEVWREREIV